jgi:hypothetical protein
LFEKIDGRDIEWSGEEIKAQGLCCVSKLKEVRLLKFEEITMGAIGSSVAGV